MASFPTLSINKIGNGYTLTAASGSLTGATSAGFNINASSANRLAFTTPARTLTAGACAGAANPITVQLQDSFANPVNAGGGGQVITASSDSGGTVTWYTDSGCVTIAS